MKFCPNCNHVMNREVSSGSIIYICGACHVSQNGTNNDLSIMSGNMTNSEVRDQYTNLIKFAADDIVNRLIKEDCENCGRDYKTQIRLGPKEIVVTVCKCGVKN